MSRRASLRTLQKAIKRFLTRSRILNTETVETAARTVLDFWAAVSLVLHTAWSKPRSHLVTTLFSFEYVRIARTIDFALEAAHGHADKVFVGGIAALAAHR